MGQPDGHGHYIRITAYKAGYPRGTVPILLLPLGLFIALVIVLVVIVARTMGSPAVERDRSEPVIK